MPTYEYACTVCGIHIEVFQRIGEEPLSSCGVCGGALRKVFHPAGILFKGSGFYKTDSRATSKSDSSAKEPTGKPSKAEAKETATESAPKEAATGASTGEAKEKTA